MSAEHPAASTCRYWLAERDGMAVTLLDGCHDDPEGVAEAAKLHRRIFGKKGEGWIMVEIHDLPDLDPPINEDAAATCAHLVMEGTPHA